MRRREADREVVTLLSGPRSGFRQLCFYEMQASNPGMQEQRIERGPTTLVAWPGFGGLKCVSMSDLICKHCKTLRGTVQGRPLAVSFSESTNRQQLGIIYSNEICSWQRFPGMKERRAQKSNGGSVIEFLLCDLRRELCFLFTPRFDPLTRERDCTSISFCKSQKSAGSSHVIARQPFAYPSFRYEPSKLIRLP